MAERRNLEKEMANFTAIIEQKNESISTQINKLHNQENKINEELGQSMNKKSSLEETKKQIFKQMLELESKDQSKEVEAVEKVLQNFRLTHSFAFLKNFNYKSDKKVTCLVFTFLLNGIVETICQF